MSYPIGTRTVKTPTAFQEAQKIVRGLNMTLKFVGNGKYRVNFKRFPEFSAYYTEDLGDAVAAARRMRASIDSGF